MPYQPRLQSTDDGQQLIFDDLRRRFVALTPEEWVRQHFVHFLIEQRNYPAALMGNEIMVRINGMSKRCDTLVCDNAGRPKVIVEYKAPSVAITRKVFDQISRYNSVMHVDYLMVSNGTQSFCVRMDYDAQSYTFMPDIPTFDQL